MKELKKIVVNPREAAEILYVGIDVVNTKCKNGELPAYRDGRNWKIPLKVLDEYVLNRAYEEAAQRRAAHETP